MKFTLIKINSGSVTTFETHFINKTDSFDMLTIAETMKTENINIYEMQDTHHYKHDH